MLFLNTACEIACFSAFLPRSEVSRGVIVLKLHGEGAGQMVGDHLR